MHREHHKKFSGTGEQPLAPELHSPDSARDFIIDRCRSLREEAARIRSQADVGDGQDRGALPEADAERLAILQGESEAWNVASQYVNNWDRAVRDLRAFNRECSLTAEVPDYRCEAAKYVEKQDVTYCIYRVDGRPWLCCKTIALEMVQAFAGTDSSECTVANYTLWYNRVSRFNLSTEVRMRATVGTIMYAHDAINHMRRQLGLPCGSAFTVIQGLVSAGDKAVDVLTSVGKIAEAVGNTAVYQAEGDTPKSRFIASLTGGALTGFALPTMIFSVGKFIAGLPYGVFGVRRMRPLKKNF